MNGTRPAGTVTTAGPAVAALMPWRQAGELRATVVLKASFAFACDTVAARVDARPIVDHDVPYAIGRGHGPRFTTDLVPWIGRVDVLFTGCAYPREGAPHGVDTRARIGVFDGRAASLPLLDKSVLVRNVDALGVPIAYDLALGGPSCPENPVGTSSPRIVATDPARPGGFGPVSAAWPARRARLEALGEGLGLPIPELPALVPWDAFSAAPDDQRLGSLRGDEWIVLEALHPRIAILRTRLPGAVARAEILGLSSFGIEDGRPVAIGIDTLQIDGDDHTMTLTWRGVVPLPSLAALEALRIVARVDDAVTPEERSEQPTPLPDTLTLPDGVVRPPETLRLGEDPALADTDLLPAETVMLGDDTTRAPAYTLPFRRVDVDATVVETALLSDEAQADAAAHPAMPFAPRAESAPPPPVASPTALTDDARAPAPPPPAPPRASPWKPAPPPSAPQPAREAQLDEEPSLLDRLYGR